MQVAVEDDAPLRRDVDSADVRAVYPDLPPSPRARNAYLHARDVRAYLSIKTRFPEFTPPSTPSEAPRAGATIESLRERFAQDPEVLAYYESKCVHGRYCPTPPLVRRRDDDTVPND